MGSAHTRDTGRGRRLWPEPATAGRSGRSPFSQAGRSSVRITLPLHHIFHQSRIPNEPAADLHDELVVQPANGSGIRAPRPCWSLSVDMAT